MEDDTNKSSDEISKVVKNTFLLMVKNELLQKAPNFEKSVEEKELKKPGVIYARSNSQSSRCPFQLIVQTFINLKTENWRCWITIAWDWYAIS